MSFLRRSSRISVSKDELLAWREDLIKNNQLLELTDAELAEAELVAIELLACEFAATADAATADAATADAATVAFENEVVFADFDFAAAGIDLGEIAADEFGSF